MNRRNFFKGLIALPIAAAGAQLAIIHAVKTRFADGGIVPPGTLYLVGDHRCELPISIKPVPSTGVDTVTVEFHCDTSALEQNLHNVRKAIQREIRNSRF